MKSKDTEPVDNLYRLHDTVIEENATKEVKGGINIDFLWVSSEIASERLPGLDWTAKILVSLAGMGARKAAGYQGLIATDEELADFLKLSSKQQVQKVIQRGISAGLLERHSMKRRILRGLIPRTCTTGIKIPKAVLEHETLTWPKKALYSLVAGMGKGKQRCCFASNEWLGKALGLSASHVRTLIGELDEEGFLSAPSGRYRHLRVTGDLPSPTVRECSNEIVTLKDDPGNPIPSPSTPSSNPGASHIRFINIKDSKDSTSAAPKYFLSERNSEHHQSTLSSDTISSNCIDESVMAHRHDANQHDVSSQTSTSDTTSSSNITVTPRWNPVSDFEWQYKQFLSVIRGCYSTMQRDRVISRNKNLVVDDAVLREFCQQELAGRIVEMDEGIGRLNFTAQFADFLQVLLRSWYGMRFVWNETGKFNPWLITKNTNDISKFLKRYRAIKGQLNNHTENDNEIYEITQAVRETVMFNWYRHGWSARWNPTGNVLRETIPSDILDHRQLEQARQNFEYNVQVAQSERQANRAKPVPELLHDGINRCWPRHFAWAMLHQAGLHEDAKLYEADTIDSFKTRPELLQVYRERMPGVMGNLKFGI
jgi:hypothetical protein